MVMFQLAMRIFVAYMFLVDRSELYKEKKHRITECQNRKFMKFKNVEDIGFW